MMRGLVVLCVLALPLRAEMSAEEVKGKIKEGAQHFREMMGASNQDDKQKAYAAMNDAFVAAAKEEKQDAAASTQVETEVGSLDSAEVKSALYFFVCDAYCQAERYKPALDYINKAIAQSKKPKYEAKKKEIEDKLK